MPDELIIPKWVWAIPVVLVLLLLGYFYSPRERDGRPILLLPDVKAVEEYRVAIVHWREQAQNLDTQISTILSGRFGEDLFTRSRESQKMIDAAVRLIQDIERQKAPTAAVPARSISISMATAYLDAARATLLWTTAPSDVNLGAAQEQLAKARRILEELEASEWTLK
jgi:hypothetical protein